MELVHNTEWDFGDALAKKKARVLVALKQETLAF